MTVLNAAELYTMKWLQRPTFTLYIFYHHKNKQESVAVKGKRRMKARAKAGLREILLSLVI